MSKLILECSPMDIIFEKLKVREHKNTVEMLKEKKELHQKFKIYTENNKLHRKKKFILKKKLRSKKKLHRKKIYTEKKFTQ